MQSEVMFAGFGGQGILSGAKILAKAGMKSGYEVAWVPSYGPEMRGGTAYCTVVISDASIGSPIIKNPRHLVAMNRPSLEKFAPTVQKKGIILINETLIPIRSGRNDVDELVISVSEIAASLGNVRTANVIALAAFTARSKLVTIDVLKQCVREEFQKKEKLIPINLKAVEAGVDAAIKNA